MAITGGCLCRAVRFTIDAEAPIAVRQCWCRDCQYFGAGSCTVNAIFRTEAVEASGPLTDFVRNADSGSVMHRHFCAQCGTQVFSVAEPRAHLTIVRVGALDDPETRRAAGDHLDEVRPALGLLRPCARADRGPADGGAGAEVSAATGVSAPWRASSRRELVEARTRRCTATGASRPEEN